MFKLSHGSAAPEKKRIAAMFCLARPILVAALLGAMTLAPSGFAGQPVTQILTPPATTFAAFDSAWTLSRAGALAPPPPPWASPTVPVGGNPVGVGVDQATDTIYVANQTDNTVSVIQGGQLQCHAHVGLQPDLTQGHDETSPSRSSSTNPPTRSTS